MAEQKWEKQCEVCGAAVKFGAFGPCNDQPGNHVVEHKIYYHMGGRDIGDIRDRVKFGPLVILQPTYTRVDPLNPDKRDLVQGVSVKFDGGKYGTNDPLEQFLLDRKGFASGDEGLKQWREIYWTPERQLQQSLSEEKDAQSRLANLKREIKESESLLDSVKNQGKPKPSGKPAMVNG